MMDFYGKLKGKYISPMNAMGYSLGMLNSNMIGFQPAHLTFH